jgi:hypothetical protein
VGTGKGVIVKLKEYECVEVKHHNDVGGTIKEWQKMDGVFTPTKQRET